MKVAWLEIDGFPDYLVSNTGLVYNMRRSVVLSVSRTDGGIQKVNLSRKGEVCTKSVARLTAHAFVPNDYDLAIFDTPIHLDGNRENCCADNLVWRPRWFAISYHQQVNTPGYSSILVNIRDVYSRKTYAGPRDAAVANGILVVDVMKSYANNHVTFPTGQSFARIDN